MSRSGAMQSAVQAAIGVGQDAYECRSERKIRFETEQPSVERDVADSDYIYRRALKLGLVLIQDVEMIKSRIGHKPIESSVASALLAKLGEAIFSRFQALEPPPSQISRSIFRSYIEDVAVIVVDIACVSVAIDTIRELAVARRPSKSRRYTAQDLRLKREKREVKSVKSLLSDPLTLEIVKEEVKRYQILLKYWKEKRAEILRII